MNALQIVQRACQQIGIPSPSTLVGLTDTVNLQILSLFYDVHDYLRNQRIFVQQKRVHTFALEANRQFYHLPQDFFAALLGTQYDDTTKFPMLGPLSDSQFDMRLYGLAGFSPTPAFRIWGPDTNPNDSRGQFQVWPMPTAAGDTLSFEYQSRNLFQPPNWTASTLLVLNNYYNASGNIYKCTTAGTTGTTAPTSQSTTAFANGTAMLVYIPQAYETVLIDTDTSIFDDDLIVSGLKAWYYQAKVQPQAEQALNVFQKKIDSARNRYYGSYRGTLSRFKRYRYAGVNPQGGWDLS